MSKHLICIYGPTAIGKTSLAIRLAQKFNTEIISFDSRQFYKEMSIGTAVPSQQELREAPHHFIQHKSIFDSYSVGDFEQEAIEKIQDLFAIKDILILVGGSGLYLNAILYGLDSIPNIPPEIREELNKTLEQKGIEYLQQLLKEKDPVTFERIDKSNPHRIIRALEVFTYTNKPFSSFLTKQNQNERFNTTIIKMNTDREYLYKTINKRVDCMIEKGLETEVSNLIGYKNKTPLNTIGYKEWFLFWEGEIQTKENVIELIKKNTRNYAKRQITWFNKYQNSFIFDPLKNELNDLYIYLQSKKLI